jgi:hypothetical protein
MGPVVLGNGSSIVCRCVPTFVLVLVLGVYSAPSVRGKDAHTSSSSQCARGLPLQVGHGMPLTVPVFWQVSQGAIVWFERVDVGQAAHVGLVGEEEDEEKEEEISVDREGHLTDDNRVR